MGYVLYVFGALMILMALLSPVVVFSSPLWAIAGAILIHAGEASISSHKQWRERDRKRKRRDDYDE